MGLASPSGSWSQPPGRALARGGPLLPLLVKKKAWSSKQAKALMRATRHVWDGCAIYVAVKERARTGTVVNTTHACMLYV